MARKRKAQSGSLPARPLGGSTAGQVVTRCARPGLNLPALDPKDCPKHLNPAARKRWREITGQLTEADMLCQLDRDALAVYCVVWSRWQQAEAKVQELGPVVKSPAGMPVTNPFLATADRAIAQLLRIGAALGLTPAARGELRRAR